MISKLKIGENLYHKYLGVVTITNLIEDGIIVNSNARGLFEFRFYDFGKVLFFNKEHSAKKHKTEKEYIAFCDEEIKLLELAVKRQKEIENRKLKIEEMLQKGKEAEEAREEQKKQQRVARLLSQTEENKRLGIELTSAHSESISTLLKDLPDKIPTRTKFDQKSKIKEILQQRKIEYLLHFTRLENLLSIMKNGFVPISMQQEGKISSVRNDELRLDGKPYCTSFSVGFPNFFLFHTFRNQHPGSKWVVIKLNTDVLFSPDNLAYYYQTNAAEGKSRALDLTQSRMFFSFEKMFSESIITKGNLNINRKDLQIDAQYTTDPQAEVLISNTIGPGNIQSICFKNSNEMKEFLSHNQSELLKLSDCFKYEVNPHFFYNRKDFQFWFRGELNG